MKPHARGHQPRAFLRAWTLPEGPAPVVPTVLATGYIISRPWPPVAAGEPRIDPDVRRGDRHPFELRRRRPRRVADLLRRRGGGDRGAAAARLGAAAS